MKKIKLYLAIMAAALTAVILTSCTVPQVVAKPDGTTVTNLTVDPKLTAGLETGQAINTASAPLNPWWPVVSAVLGAVGVVATAVAKVKTDQKNSVQGQLKAVVIAVDKADDADLKKAINAEATAAGVEDALHKTVKLVGSGLL